MNIKHLTAFIIFLHISFLSFSQLRFVDRIHNGTGGIEGINSPTSVVMSPDDKNLYVMGNRRSIANFKYSQTNGNLEYVECLSEDINIQGIMGIFQMDIDKEGIYCYGVLKDSNSVVVFKRDTTSGALTLIQTIKNKDAKNCLTKSTYIKLLPNGNFAYSISESKNTINVFKVDHSNGYLSFIDSCNTNIIDDYGFYRYYIEVSNDSRNLYLTSMRNREILTFNIDSISGKLDFKQKLTLSDLFDSFYTPLFMKIAPNDKFLYACCNNNIILLERNSSNGLLKPIQNFPLNTAFNLFQQQCLITGGTITKDNKYFIATSNFSSIVMKFQIDQTNGFLIEDTLLYPSNYKIYTPFNNEGYNTLSLTNDQKNIFIASYFDSNIIRFSNLTDSLKQNIKFGSGGISKFKSVSDFVITKNDKYVFALCDSDSTIHSLKRDLTTGKLFAQNKQITDKNIYGTSGLTLSTDNKTLYICNYSSIENGNSVTVFSIDTSNGDINLIQNIPNNDINTYGTMPFLDIVCSYDDKNVYALSSSDDIIKIYSRNKSTGKLTFINNITVSPIGKASFFSAKKIILSKDNIFLYLIADQGIKVLKRDINGQLTTIQTIDYTVRKWNYINTSQLSDDQTTFFFSNMFYPYLSEYKRDPNTGLISFSNEHLNSENRKFEFSYEIFVSKDKKIIYLTTQKGSSKIYTLEYNETNKQYVEIDSIDNLLYSDYGLINRMRLANDNYHFYASSSNGAFTSTEGAINHYGPKINLKNYIEACEGDTVTLSSNFPFLAYRWSTGESSKSIKVTKSGVYSIKVDYQFDKHGYDSCIVKFNPRPKINLGNDTTICKSSNFYLSTSNIYKKYLWENGDTTNSKKINNEGDYSLKVWNEYNCSASDSIKINLLLNKPNVFLGNDTSFCIDNFKSFMLNAFQNNITNYKWNDNSINSTFLVEKMGRYIVQVTNACGYSNDTIYIQIDDKKGIELGEDKKICEGKPLILKPISTIKKFNWNNNSTDSILYVTKSGLYRVTGINACGTFSDSINIETVSKDELFIPNIITPNNDNLNEYFKLPVLLKGCNLSVINRWGDEIFEGKNYDNTWDANNISDGIYFYNISNTCFSDNLKGWIQIAR